MLPSVDRLRLVPVLLVANAASILLFRFFLTLDGPMHVLHACALKSAWFSARYANAQVDYLINLGTLDLFDLILVPLTVLLSPGVAHAFYGALVVLVLGLGAWSLARAAGAGDRPLLVWVLPLGFSFILIMGFMTFLLATGLAMFAAGWWMRQGRITVPTALKAGGLLIACQATHRVGGSLALMMMACYEVILFVHSRQESRERWGILPPKLRNALLIVGFGGMLYKVLSAVLTSPRVRVPGNPEFWLGLFRLRPLLLFDAREETPFLIVLGLLLVISLALALFHRFASRANGPATDALFLAGLFLLAVSVLVRTPNAELLYIGTRAQTIALLLLGTWVAVVVPKNGWSTALAGLVLVVHSWRMVHVEQRMAGSRQVYEQALEVVDRLPEHGVTLPVVCDDNWMHEHLSAFVAASYRGIFFSPGDHLGFLHHAEESWQLRDYSDGFQQELRWLEDHVTSNAPPVIDHIVLFGHGKPVSSRVSNLFAVRDKHFFLQWKNDYAEVWVRDPLR
ncbi:MAG: hypothetical protein KA791_07605 [Flavobacteriales bacterium]|nr:hypothetical protein [Flavobacteriales bacterium]